MKKIFFLVLLLVGCASTEPIVGPDGTTHQLIRCVSVKNCYKIARQICGGNYKIVNSTNNVGGAQQQTSTDINMLIKCDSP